VPRFGDVVSDRVTRARGRGRVRAMPEPRAYRPARSSGEAARLLREQAGAGKLAVDAVDAVLESVGERARPVAEPPWAFTPCAPRAGCLSSPHGPRGGPHADHTERCAHQVRGVWRHPHPWYHERSPGGSSGGSAVALDGRDPAPETVRALAAPQTWGRRSASLCRRNWLTSPCRLLRVGCGTCLDR
jgi:hypothetical protein